MLVHILVEGFVDEALALRLLQTCQHEAGVTYGKKGWTYIQQKAQAFDKTCVTSGLLTLVDFMDTGAACPPSVVTQWLPHQSHLHVFRVVVREIESWILADRTGIAKFLGVPLAKIPHDPESLSDPKQVLINLARGSRQRAVRDALVPPEGYSSSEGPLYSSEIARFISRTWDAQKARELSGSLDKCIERLMQLHK